MSIFIVSNDSGKLTIRRHNFNSAKNALAKISIEV